MPTTYDLMQQARYLLGLIEADEGVLSETTERELKNWLAVSEDKVHACFAARKRIDAEADVLRDEERRLAIRRRALETASDRIGELATGILLEREQMGEPPKVKTSHYSAWLQDTQAVSGPDDVSSWPQEWTRTKVEPDRLMAMKALTAGETRDGFGVVTRRSIRWR